jgi:hypothetical protein
MFCSFQREKLPGLDNGGVSLSSLSPSRGQPTASFAGAQAKRSRAAPTSLSQCEDCCVCLDRVGHAHGLSISSPEAAAVPVKLQGRFPKEAFGLSLDRSASPRLAAALLGCHQAAMVVASILETKEQFMSDTINNETAGSKSPTHIAYHVHQRDGGKPVWTRIGVAWAHAGSTGLNLQLDRITLRVAPEKKD